MSSKRPSWAAPGDINAFFGLMLDNIADLVLAVGLLTIVYEFPTEFALKHMVPGTAIGVVVGDVLFFWMALRLMRRTGRNTVTAMPLGLDTPSTFGMVFFVLGPAFLAKKSELGILGQNSPDVALVSEAARHAWHIGICSIVISGVFKFACSLGANWIRRVVPRAGLLGSLAAIALVLISFLPLLEILHFPLAGLAALGVILVSLVARVRMPFRIPGALAGLLVGTLIYYLTLPFTGAPAPAPEAIQFRPPPTEWLDAWRFEWLAAWGESLRYLPVVIPFALATVIGGIDCTESAAAAGDEYDTNRIVAVEALATLVAGLCGGVIQTTPYIGHPAYKAMGGRAAYTLATALFVGGAGLIGYFEFLYVIVPKAAVFPILIFVGLEITAQSFHATPTRHYPAVVLACVPALASLILIFTDPLQSEYEAQVQSLNRRVEDARDVVSRQRQATAEAIRSLSDSTGADAVSVERLRRLLTRQREELESAVEAIGAAGGELEKVAGNHAKDLIGEPQQDRQLAKNLQTLRLLNGGFIVTSLLWASILAALIDHRFLAAAVNLAVAAVFSLFGVIHSPLPGSPLVNPLRLPELPQAAHGQEPIVLCVAYLLVAAMVLILNVWLRRQGHVLPPPKDD